MLNRKQLNEIRQRLDNRYTTLLGEIQAGRAKAGFLGGDNESGDANHDRSEDIRATDIAQAELGRDWQELGEVQRAIARMESGDYGTCTDCGKPIPVRRLLTAPESVRCIDCQQRVERAGVPSGHDS